MCCNTDKVLLAGVQYQVVHQAILSSGLSFQECVSQGARFSLPTLTEIQSALSETGAQVLFLTLPNNPSGEQYSFSEFSELLSLLKKQGTYLVIDKVGSDIPIHPSIQPLNVAKAIDENGYWERAFLVDSLSKRRAVSGLRFGYLIGSLSLIRFVYERRIGCCPPNIATEGLARELFYSAYLHYCNYQMFENRNSLITLTKRLEVLSSGTSRNPRSGIFRRYSTTLH